MTAGHYVVRFLAIVAGSLFASIVISTWMLYGFKWMDDSAAFGNSGWVLLFLLARLLLIPIMLCMSIWMGYRAIRILMRRVEVFPPTASSAITFFGVTATYVSLGLLIPIFAVFTPVILEPPLYALAAILLLVVTVNAISEDGQLPGPSLVSTRMAVILVAAAWIVITGASLAYARFVLAGNAVDCTVWDCPPERTVGVMGFMMAAATVTAIAVAWGLRSPRGMTRRGIVSAVAFACLALLFPVTIMPGLVMPFDAFVPSFFYGIAAVAFLIVAVARKDEDQ